MHELSLLEALRELVEEQARRHGGGRVRCITLRIGSLAGVEAGALHFAHDVVMQGSLAEGSRLVIEPVPACWQCGRCALPFTAEDPACPRCGDLSRELLQGRELDLASIELEAPTPHSPRGESAPAG
ncbi:MAG: hydrogenase maturation nickel metallochaperone HypA [Prochlorococcaceae cyanobacterium]|jgi:hydrogenase nickel incorporation protein HypA/HybF